MALSSKLAAAIAFICTSWILCFYLIGETDRGHAFFNYLSSLIFTDTRAGLPLITLAIPGLVSGSACSLLLVAPSVSPGPRGRAFYSNFLCKWICSRCCMSCGGDLNFDILAGIFIALPCLVFLSSYIHRHISGSDGLGDDELMDIGNSLGKTAMLCLSFFLIPVAHQSPLLQLMGWSPVQAIRMHIWAGRICMLFSILHGLFHAYRWFHAGENIWRMMVPPRQCWAVSSTSFEPQCINNSTDCSCYDFFRNLAGVTGVIFLTLIGFTSRNSIRRNYYRLFYKTHIVAGPAALLVIILHWNRMFLYICPSILYYSACSLPVVMQRSQSRKEGGVRVVAVEEINDDIRALNRAVFSMTFGATKSAVARYRPGQYVKLYIPDISGVPHPFTVNVVPESMRLMRIIFRSVGPFTCALRDRLLNANEFGLPIIAMEAFCGCNRRFQQVLSHDVVTMVAGGVGITPFLSLLHFVVDEMQSQTTMNRLVLKEIHLHWICRDEGLIDYVYLEYLDLLLDKARNGSRPCRISINIHRTCKRKTRNVSSNGGLKPTYFSENGNYDRIRGISLRYLTGISLKASLFSAGAGSSIKFNSAAFLVFSSVSWSGLAIIWYCYTNIQHPDDKVAARAWSVFFAVLASVCLSYLFTCCSRMSAVDELMPVRNPQSSGIDMVPVEDKKFQNGMLSSTPGQLESTRDVLFEDRDTYEDSEMVELDIAAHENDDDIVTVTESNGRPSVDSLLQQSKNLGAWYPGLFICGPTSLMDDVKKAASQCSTRIAVYQENFHF